MAGSILSKPKLANLASSKSFDDIKQKSSCHTRYIQNPCAIEAQARDSYKVNVWCDYCDLIIGAFFFFQVTAHSDNYLDILKIFTFPQIEDF